MSWEPTSTEALSKRRPQMRSKYDDYSIDFTQDCIFGQIGLSVSLDSLILFSNTVFNYCNLLGVQIVVLGYDSSKWSQKFCLEVVLERLTELGIEVHFLDQAAPSAALSWATNRVWLDSEKSRLTLGMYFASDDTQSDTLSIHFRHHTGLPFTEEDMAQVVAQSFKLQIVELGEILQPVPESIPLERFTKSLLATDLLDKKLLSKTVVSFDNMFGASEEVIQLLRKDLKFNGQLVNKASENLRIEGYRSIPTERWLEWKAPTSKDMNKLRESYFHGAISNAGDQIGVWDLRQALEISPSGIAMIFLKYYAEALKKKGTIIISKLVSDRVVDLAEKLGFKVHLVDSGLDSFAKGFEDVGKRSALMYVDELGRFWFKGEITEPNGITSLLLLTQICERYKTSPGQLLDAISKKFLDRKYVYGRLGIPVEMKTKEELEDILRRDLNLSQEGIGNTTIFRTDYGAKVSLVYDKKSQITFVEIESQEENTTREIVQIIQNNCYDPEMVDEEINNSASR